MDVLNWTTAILGVSLQLAIIAGLLRGSFRTYPMLLVIMVANFLGTIAASSAIFDLGKWTIQTARLYWICETLQYVLIFAFQVHLLYQTLTNSKSRRRILYVIFAGLLVAVFATWSAYHPRFNLWMTQLIRNFSFASMILNLALWTTLLRSPDRCRLMITGAFGTMLAGGAIGHSLRQISHSLVPLGNAVLISTYLLYLFLLWRAVSRYAVPQTNATEEPFAALHPAGSLPHSASHSQ